VGGRVWRKVKGKIEERAKLKCPRGFAANLRQIHSTLHCSIVRSTAGMLEQGRMIATFGQQWMRYGLVSRLSVARGLQHGR
jgi:hypothetical protein